jgi:hypothetical protein
LSELNEKLKSSYEKTKTQEEQLRKKSEIEQNLNEDLKARESRINFLESENRCLIEELKKIKQERDLLQAAPETKKQIAAVEQQEKLPLQPEKLSFSLSNSSESNHEEPIEVKTVKKVDESKVSKNLSFMLSFSETETSSEDEEICIEKKERKSEEYKKTQEVLISESFKERIEEKSKDEIGVKLEREAAKQEEEEETLVPISEISLNTNEINVENINYESDNESVSSSTSSTSSNVSSSSSSCSSASSSSSTSSRSNSLVSKQKTDKTIKSDNIASVDFGFSDFEDQEESKIEIVQEYVDRSVETEKIEQLVNAYMQNEIEKLLVEVQDQTQIEMRICEFIRDKLISEEINQANANTAQLFKSIATKVIDEELQERKQQERRFVIELKEKIESELLNKILAENLNSLIRECCERVVQEARNERIQAIYENILDEVIYKALKENVVLEMVFDDMIIPTKPLIEPIKYEFKPKESPVKISQPVKRRLYQSDESPMSLNQEFNTSISNLSAQVKKSRLAESVSVNTLHTPVASNLTSPIRTSTSKVDEKEMSEFHPKSQYIPNHQHKSGYLKLDCKAFYHILSFIVFYLKIIIITFRSCYKRMHWRIFQKVQFQSRLHIR